MSAATGRARPAKIEREGGFSLFGLSETRSIRLIQLAGLATFLTIWELGGAAQPFLWSQPSRTWSRFLELAQEDLAPLLLASLGTLILGLTIALVAGVALGVLHGRFRTFRVVFDPYFAGFYSIPRVALVPLMIIWFGIQRPFVVASVVAACTILIVFSTTAGIREALRSFDEVSRALNITGWRKFTGVLLPGAIPFIATGLRLAVQRALVAVIVGEFLVGLDGVGSLLREARTESLVDLMFATAFVLMIVGVILFTLTSWLERRFSRWRPAAF